MTSEQDVIKQLLLDAAEQAGPLDASLDGVTARIRKRRRVRTSALGLAAGCIAAGAVIAIQAAVGPSSHSKDSTASPDTSKPETCTATVHPVGDNRSCQYIGLTLAAARALAAAENRDLQITNQDGVPHSITYEYRLSRVTVTVVKDRVTTAHIG
ncbi:hypothetical protein [Streptomyces sp. NPDC096339]|uniref:hypothetical protein n=1 Tax=Streptomyces sp. NPDC096339 TaxID=3366086 RepID=UPI00381B42D9